MKTIPEILAFINQEIDDNNNIINSYKEFIEKYPDDHEINFCKERIVIYKGQNLGLRSVMYSIRLSQI